MFQSGVQSEFRLDSRQEHAGMTDTGKGKLRGIQPTEIESNGVAWHYLSRSRQSDRRRYPSHANTPPTTAQR
jgi:hypothetical protein